MILETDAQSKCDKYVHLGMELVGTHDLGAFGKLYDLIRYPESSNENGTTLGKDGGAIKKEKTKLFIRWCIR